MTVDNQTQEPVTEEHDSLLSMSDEEFMQLESPLEVEAQEEAVALTNGEDREDEGGNADPDAETIEENEDTEEETVDSETDSDDEEDDTDETEDSEGKETETEKNEEVESEDLDYKSFYEQITAPFQANGKQMKVDSVEDAIQLMKMGAGYNKKMAGLKPHLKKIKLLENNGLLDDEKINFLIDLDKKNPEAIQKLIKDSDIDPLDIDTQKESDYKPNTYQVDDKDLALDEVIREISDTDTFNKTTETVKAWDKASKEVVSDNPGLIKVINDHMASGVYDVIQTTVEREKILGRLTGLSDIEAYRQVGDAIQKKGGFDHLFQDQEQRQEKSDIRIDANPSKANKDPQLKAKKRAASSKKPAKSRTPKADFNPLAMSDEEFEKVGLDKFI